MKVLISLLIFTLTNNSFAREHNLAFECSTTARLILRNNTSGFMFGNMSTLKKLQYDENDPEYKPQVFRLANTQRSYFLMSLDLDSRKREDGIHKINFELHNLVTGEKNRKHFTFNSRKTTNDNFTIAFDPTFKSGELTSASFKAECSKYSKEKEEERNLASEEDYPMESYPLGKHEEDM